MRKIKVKTVDESKTLSLIKVFSTKTNKIKTLKHKILEVIESGKSFEIIESGISFEKTIESLLQPSDYNQKKYKTKLDDFSEDITVVDERAYQRGLLNSKNYIHSLGEVVWHDIELPVVFNKNPRRPSVHLIGTLNNNTPVLCELKFGLEKSTTDNPVYAAIELLIYYYLIQMNWKALDEQEVFHKNKRGDFSWKEVNDNSMLMVGANKAYWDSWKENFKGKEKEIQQWYEKLPLPIRLFSSDNFNFNEQKGNEEKYKPDLGKIEWTEVQF